MNRNQLFIAIGAGLILIIGGVFFFGSKPPSPQSADLEMWGVEDENVWRDIILKFQETRPHIKVAYRRFDEDRYEETLINRLAEGRGPDIFMLKNSWTAKHRDKIRPLPQNVFDFSANDLRAEFADIASRDLIADNGDLLGLPLYIDTLALFYDSDAFNDKGIASPPRTWEEAGEIGKKFVKLSPVGDLQKSGIALGTFNNIEHAYEIISAFLLQHGDPIIDPADGRPVLGDLAEDALNFYVSFADPSKQNFSWSGRLSNSLTALADGTTAMAIGFSSDIARLRAKNPHLSLRVSALPQLRESSVRITYGSYFFPTVSKFSQTPEAAWEFILYLGSAEGAKLYTETAQKPPARRDLIEAKSPVQELDIFYRQALSAKSWTPPDENIARRLFKDAVESILSKTAKTGEALELLRERLLLLIP